MEQLLYKAEEAAAVLSVGRTTVYELMSTGALPSVHIGRSRRIKADALAAYVAALNEGES